MRKTHYRVTLDVFVHSDETVDAAKRLGESGFVIDPDSYDEGVDILDITVENVEATDSR